MKKIVGIIFHLLWLSLSLSAQHQELSEKPNIWLQNEEQKPDTNTILNAFKKGSMKGHFRYYFSATDNQSGLSDYYANAAGGGLRFETARFIGFQFGISGFYIFNVGSSNLAEPDSKTGQTNRYEIGLFDVANPSDKNYIDRLEELFIKYNFRKSSVEIGKILVNTPLINLQDGRMRPSGVEGIWFELNELKKVKLSGGFIWSFSPRSTTEWYKGGKSIGVYPVGVDARGEKSNYAGNVVSSGVGVLGISFKPKPNLKIQVWDFYIERVLNTAFVQLDFEKQSSGKSVLSAGFQAIRQDAAGNGGNMIPERRYVEENSSSFTLGARLGWQKEGNETSLNFNHISGMGRYVFPREWGRDPFFTFMPRERNEGLADASAITLKLGKNFSRIGFKAVLTAGYFLLPEVIDFRNNKYGIPSYSQVNLDLRYGFSGILSGLEAQGLVVGKFNQGRVYGNDKYIFNKVNMFLYNLILNYRF